MIQIIAGLGESYLARMLCTLILTLVGGCSADRGPGPGPSVDLRAALSLSDGTVAVGSDVRYTVTVLNNGASEAPAVVVLDTLPPGLELVGHTVSVGQRSGARWDIGSLAPSASATLVVTARVTNTAANLVEKRIHVRSAGRETVPGDNTAGIMIAVMSPTPEPGYTPGTDVLVYEDGFDEFATVDERHQRLLQLRQAEGANTHRTFVSDNRFSDSPGALHYQLHGISSPGRGGTGRALRSTYLDVDQNQSSVWITWPIGARKYQPDTATVAIQYWMRTTTPGWQLNWPGFKFFEYWHVTGGSRSQFGVLGPAGNERFHLNPESRGAFGIQPPGTMRWAELMDGQWHRVTYLIKPSDALGDTRGIARLWIDGRKVVDVSAAGVADGFSSVTDVRQVASGTIAYLKWPDVLNSNEGRGTGTLEFDDLRWWIER